MNTTLNKVKRILLLSDSTKDEILNDFIEMYTKAILLKTGSIDFPEVLNFILVEAVTARYRKLGSEGMISESIDSVSQTFHDEVLIKYENYFNEYRKQNGLRPRIRFL